MQRVLKSLFALVLLAPLVVTAGTAPVLQSAQAGPDGAIRQFTMKFSQAMVPLGEPRAPAPASVSCPVPAQGRWTDVQTYVFEFAKALPGGLKCTVTLRPNLKTVSGDAVTGQKISMIDTGGPSARDVLGGTEDEIEENQVFLVAPNIVPNPASIAANVYCSVEGIEEKIPADVLPAGTAQGLIRQLGTDNYRVSSFLEKSGAVVRDDNTGKLSKPDDAIVKSLIALKCHRPLPPGHDMSLVWGAGVAAPNGMLAGRDQRFDFSVRKGFEARFECNRVNPRAGCNPVTSAYVRFTADVPLAMAQAVRLTFPDGTSLSPKISDDDRRKGRTSDLEFKGPLPAATAGNVVLPANIADESGRKLENAQRFPLPFEIDKAPPLIKFAANFGILEAKEGGILPVTVRAVEPQLERSVKAINGQRLRVDASDGEIARWLRDVAKHEEDSSTEVGEGEAKHTVNHTGDTPLLGGGGTTSLKLALPAQGKAFEVVGVPLKELGFYVVELASPELGRSLLGRDATRYVTSAALVTNMAVHFKWGRQGSLAWVTTLDKAKVVAGADIRVTDSCTGKMLFQGTSDKQGRLVVTDLPEPTSGSYCDADSDKHPLMVSARKDGDFSFTMTAWGKGIAPYDFDLPYGWSAPEDILHTVFDRSLMRVGETVNMKHILRRPTLHGFSLAKGFSGTLVLTNQGSNTTFEQAVTIGADGIGESHWTAPLGAPQGDYALSFKLGETEISTGQTIRVDQYRLPSMRATIKGPKEALVRPKSVPLDFFVGYFSGGAAGKMPVAIRTSYSLRSATPTGWEDWTFGGKAPVTGTVPLNDNGSDDTGASLPLAASLPLTLGDDGTAKTTVDLAHPVDDATDMLVEMDYQDANGETLTASHNIALYAANLRLGLKTDGWLMRDTDLRLRLVALDLNGKPISSKAVHVDVFTREVLTARRRLIGGFYAYDSQVRTTHVGAGCSATTDAHGLATCKLAPGVSGEVYVVATTLDSDGNVARAVQTVWLAGGDEWWFGGDNGDRMDLVPEQKSYKVGDIAKFQVRMPFRKATALVSVEREGVISSFVTELSGKDPVVNVPMVGGYAPNVYVSVMAVRGRVEVADGWLAKIARFLHLPFFDDEAREPTALVDLAKPSYRIGIAKVAVGWEAHKLDVKVTADRSRYGVREMAKVDVAVSRPNGKLPADTEIAFVAVDDALLSLRANNSVDVLDAMMGQRDLSVLTSTAQTQIVGKRHYGSKAVEAGGGGGHDAAGTTRDDFKPVLLWQGRVKLDANGHAKLNVPLVDSLSSYRLIAVATGGEDVFGTGSTTIHTAQDLSIYSGIPPLVRTGDWFGATWTLHNGSDHAMTVQAKMVLTPAVASAGPLTVTIPAGGTAPVTWTLTAPANVASLSWRVEAQEVGGKAADRIEVSQEVIPAIPTQVWASMLTQGGSLPLQAPAGALAGQGFVDVKLSDTLAPPLGTMRDYMALYPYNCFEQRLSRIIALGDVAGWNRLAKEIPAFLDGDGLLRYFPDQRMTGSDTLTSYVLSVTAETGLEIPADTKAKMMAALQAVAAGQLKHDYAWSADGRLIRIAALGALARNGTANPALVAANYVAPTDAPTSILIDWLTALDKTKVHPEWRAQAERIARARLVYAGSRLDLTSGANEPWYAMSSPDEAANKLLAYVLDRPEWSGDVPKLMVGVATRQQRGHWDTTPANAWGAIATQRFAKRFPASAIKGVTSLTLGTSHASQSWPMAANAAPIKLPLPFARTPLVMAQTGGALPWALVSVHAAVPLKQPLFAGYRITREVSAISQKTAGQWTRGDVMKIRLTIEASAGRNWVVINDPVPPGATILNGLGGQSALFGAQASGGSQPSYVDRAKDGWRGYFEWVPDGKLTTEYAVRLNGAGRFSLPPTHVEAMYSPDIHGDLPNAALTVGMR